MRQEDHGISSRTLILRYVTLALITASLATTFVASFWMIHLWVRYMNFHPGLWVNNIDTYGAWWDVGVIRKQGYLQVYLVDPGGAAAKAGIQAGDSLTAVDGVALKEQPQIFFLPFIGAKPGKKIQLEFRRGGVTQTRDLMLEESVRITSPMGDLGASYTWITPGIADSLNLGSRSGLLISKAERGTPAAEAGLRPNDIILSIARKILTEESQIKHLVEAAGPGARLEITFLRNGDTLSVDAVPGERPAFATRLYGSIVRGSPAKLAWLEYFPPVLLGLLFFLVGAPIGWLRPRDRIAFEYSMWFQCLAVLSLTLTNQPLWASWPNWALTAYCLLLCLLLFVLVPLTLRLFSSFPIRTRLGQIVLRWQWIAFLACGLGFMAPELTGDLARIYGWKMPSWMSSNPVTRFYYSWGVTALTIIMVGLMASLLIAQRVESRHHPQSRLRIVELSLMLFVTALVIGGVVPDALRAVVPSESMGPARIVLAYFLPIGLLGASGLSFGYAVLARKVLGIRLIIRKGIQHLLLSRGVLIVEGLLLFLILEESIRHGRTKIGGSVPAVAGLAAVTSVFLIVGLTRVNRPLMHRIDRRFFRETYDGRRVLVGLSQQVSSIRDREEILRRAGEAVLATLHPARVAFWLRSAQDQSLAPVWSQEPAGGTRHPVSQEQLETTDTEDAGIIAQHMTSLEEGRQWLDVTSERQDQRAEDDASASQGLEILVALPSSQGVIGCIALAGKLSEEPFSREDKELLTTVATQMGLALENAQLLEVAKREAEQAKELGIARQVQQNLFPKDLPKPQGWDFAAICRPAREVGGDYYDIFQIDEDHVAIALGDVSGKGIGPALVMSNVQAMIRAELRRPSPNLGEVLSNVNEYLQASTTAEMFITLFLAVLDLKTGALRYVNGGHNPPLVTFPGAEAPIKLTDAGPIVGIIPGMEYSESALMLGPKSILAIYSDGVTEAINQAEDMFGEERLVAEILEAWALDASGVMHRILESVDRFAGKAEQADDISLIIVRRAGQ